jgi:hypothetical protein
MLGLVLSKFDIYIAHSLHLHVGLSLLRNFYIPSTKIKSSQVTSFRMPLKLHTFKVLAQATKDNAAVRLCISELPSFFFGRQAGSVLPWVVS